MKDTSSYPSSEGSHEYRARFSGQGAKVMLFTLIDRSEIVVELTSPKARYTDLVIKWIEYALTKIRLYVISETRNVSTDGCLRVIVGSRESIKGYQREVTREPLVGTAHSIKRAHVKNDYSSSSDASNSSVFDYTKERSSKSYYTKIYEANEIVDSLF